MTDAKIRSSGIIRARRRGLIVRNCMPNYDGGQRALKRPRILLHAVIQLDYDVHGVIGFPSLDNGWTLVQV